MVLVSLLISQFLLYSKGFYAISADEAGHTLEAFQWYSGKASLFSIWLPFQKVLYGTSFHFYYNLIWVPRILSSLVGHLTVLSLIFLTYELFSERMIAILAGFLGSIFSCLVIFSVLPMNEIYFFFFTIISIALLLNWKRTKSSVSLVSLIVLSGIGTTVRYEAWIFTFVIFFIIAAEFYRSTDSSTIKLFKIIGAFLLLFAFPVFWLYLSYSQTGHVFNFVNSVAGRYSQKIERYHRGIIDELKNNVLYYFLVINLLSLNILGLSTLIIFL